MEQKKGFLKGLATVLNIGGSALVDLYDVSASMASKSAQRVKEALPKLSDTAIHLLKNGTTFQPAEKRELKSKIRALQGKIEKLHYEIGVESSKGAGEDGEINSDSVKNRIAQVITCRGEIDAMQARLVEIEEEIKAGENQKRTPKASAAIPQADPGEQTVRGGMALVEQAQTVVSVPEESAQMETTVPEQGLLSEQEEPAATREGEMAGEGAISAQAEKSSSEVTDSGETPFSITVRNYAPENESESESGTALYPKQSIWTREIKLPFDKSE